SSGRELLDGRPDVALAALETVIDGRVDEVDAVFGGGYDGRRVIRIGLCIWLAEVCADAERRHYQAVRFAKMAFGGASSEAIGVALRAFECCGFGHSVLRDRNPARRGAACCAPTKAVNSFLRRPPSPEDSRA